MLFKRKVSNTIPTYTERAENMRIGMKFVDVNGVIYEVLKSKKQQGVTYVYAVTTSPNHADGWFQRDTYEVIR